MKKIIALFGLGVLSLGLLFGFSNSNVYASTGSDTPQVMYSVLPESTIVTDEGVTIDVYKTPLLRAGGNGSWDLKGTEPWILNGNGTPQKDSTYRSSGGDYMMRVPAHKLYSKTPIYDLGPSTAVTLYEEDPDNPDDYVTSWTVFPSSTSKDYVVRNINRFLDGANNYAEFYTMHENMYSTDGGRIEGVKYYD
ncbi:MAG: hypothetical protein ABS939_08190 [Psychrobacillus sp.]